ncbi:MAG: ferrous iron transport protein A [Firmicutes bacterium]|jgi:Fe2+ transport system protein FeoA|nr:ferrous iron transport protein A [Bacillota bacterium]
MLPLLKKPAGSVAVIAEIATCDRTVIRKMSSLGIVPGVSVTVLRHSPAVLLQSGHTKIALDRNLAGLVYVK